MLKCPKSAKWIGIQNTSGYTNGVMHTHIDSPAWQRIEKQRLECEKKPQHLCLGLVMDAVNPFWLWCTTWSAWLVFLVDYRIPPWLPSKKWHLFLSLLIAIKYKAEHMDIYLPLVVDELKFFWEVINIQNVSRHKVHRPLELRKILLWTMHDFVRHEERSGLRTSGP